MMLHGRPPSSDAWGWCTVRPRTSILSGDDHPEAQLICARPITSSLEPGVRILHRPCRPLLPGLDQAHRAALDDHVHRPTRLGQWVLISGSWYKFLRIKEKTAILEWHL